MGFIIIGKGETMWSTKEGKPQLIDVKSRSILKTKPLGDGETRELTQFGTDMLNREFKAAADHPDVKDFKKRNWFFTSTDWIPALGRKTWDGHIFICGSTGAGKSYIIKKMLMEDVKQRKIYLITDLEDKDPSFKELWSSGRLKRVVLEPKKKLRSHEVDVVTLNEKIQKSKKGKGIVLIFDDVSPRKKSINAFRDDVLEKGRHKNITAIVVTHQMRAHGLTKSPLNDSEYIICFPSANRSQVLAFLKDKMDMPAWKRRMVVDKAKSDGRHLTIHLWAPNFIASAKSVMMM